MRPFAHGRGQYAVYSESPIAAMGRSYRKRSRESK